jgi:hypothetical protein
MKSIFLGEWGDLTSTAQTGIPAKTGTGERRHLKENQKKGNVSWK